MKPIDFDRDLIDSIRVNTPGILARAATLGTRRTYKKESQAAVYLRAVRSMDLTTLEGSDTEATVERMCDRALNPVPRSTLDLFRLSDLTITVGAVCVYPAWVATAARAVGGRIPVASVATGFPDGHTFKEVKELEIEMAICAGASEIDVVISRNLALDGKWYELYSELRDFAAICSGRAKMKSILEVGDLVTHENVAKASAVAIMAGADFIKTSTGKKKVNATLYYGLVMVRQIRRFRELFGRTVGFKPAGGIRTAKDVQLWFTLVEEELGFEATKPELFRIGAGNKTSDDDIDLLKDIQRQLHHLATEGDYGAAHHFPVG